MSHYVITNVRIFDGTGREPFAGEVVIDGNRIAAVTPRDPGVRTATPRPPRAGTPR